MSLAELVPMVQTLPRADKQRLAELLVGELASEDDELIMKVLGNSPKTVWSPFFADGSAESLLGLLNEDEASK